jgi:salicylate hydroxylase
MMATGAQSGEGITDIYSDPPQRTVRRSRLLDEMRSVLPDSTVVTGKRLLSINQRPDAEKMISLTFEDGDVVIVDAVVGADGINSIVRRHISNEEGSANQVNWIPSCNTRIVMPMPEAQRIFGEPFCSQATQIGWIGQNGFCLTDHEDDGQAMQVIASLRAKEPFVEVHGKPFVQVEKEFWTSRLKAWDFGGIGEKICQVIENQDSVYASCARQHDETPIYSEGRICLAGDASGNFSPALGAGALQGIEDALILATILGDVGELEELEKAFQVYDSMRHPRRKWVTV